MRYKDLDERVEEARAKCRKMYEDQDIINFETADWWEPLAEYRIRERKTRRDKYPYVAFKRIVWAYQDNLKFPIPSIVEWKILQTTEVVSKIKNYLAKGWKVHDWFFPTHEHLGSEVDHRKRGVVHIHGWRQKLMEDPNPWSDAKEFLEKAIGNTDAADKLRIESLATLSQNKTLTEKVRELKAKLEKENEQRPRDQKGSGSVSGTNRAPGKDDKQGGVKGD